MERILIPLDGSETAEAILPQVRRVLRRQDAEVILLSVVPLFSPDFHLAAPPPLEDAEKDLVAACIPVALETRRGDAATEILASAREHGADLIAMSTHGRSGPARWVFGSVTEEVLRAATVPMLVVRQGRA